MEMLGSSSTEAQDLNQKNSTATRQQDSMPHEVDEEDNRNRHSNSGQNVNEEEDDEDDVDFNPFLKESNSLEASSSLSYEVEDLNAEVADSGRKPCASSVNISVEKDKDIGIDSQASGSAHHDEETVSQMAISCDVSASDPQILAISDTEAALISQSETGLLRNTDGSTSIAGVHNAAESNPTVDVDSEGAICMRTRARYSLASFTLDELETFLQETDDEDDLQNVDDEVEYRKFLAAVMRGDEDCQNLQGNANAEDEDEENDADFELELEEALDSDVEEIEERRVGRRNRFRKKTSIEGNNKFTIQSRRPLRPRLPFASLGSVSAFDGINLAPNIVQPYMVHVNNGFTCGFTTHQIGQLHCLIHEHVQLLVQVFSVCIIDHCKGNIAMEVKKLILEMLQKCDQALAGRTTPYPSFCFVPPLVQPSVRDSLHKTLPSSVCSQNGQVDAHSTSYQGLHSETSSSQNLPHNSWVPYISGPLLSVMDVAPLRLVGNYIDEVSSSVKALERHRLEHGLGTHCQNNPLFPLHNIGCSTEFGAERDSENASPNTVGLDRSPSSNQMPKKTMAATLLERARSQPVALVPKEIADLAKRFYPLFNPALYPHQPPHAALAKRVLFTDAEDELLALGLMEYNTNWKAIQQRFLPCKSRHQIFVRQKNRASSKAPENPIKAVRRMKNSPLTIEELARIEVGWKKYNLDWPSVCRYFVPHRDPSLLPRQYRVASGTQKSYKSDATKRAKRRLYELRRKTTKQLGSTRHSSSEEEGHSSDNPMEETTHGDEHMDKEDEAYVHEAFLADWTPVNSIPYPTQEGKRFREQIDRSCSAGIQSPWISKSPAQRLSNSEIVLRPYRARKPKSSNLVKLAPGLPPVNLPPSVRVISQASFRNSREGAPMKVSGNASRANDAAPDYARTMTKPGIHYPMRTGQSRSDSAKIIDANQVQEYPNASHKCIVDSGGDADLQMHPLLFQSPRDGHLPYYPLTHDTSTSSFALFSGKQPQLSLSLFHNPRHIKDAVNFLSNSSKLLDKDVSSSAHFHPLLRRTDEIDADSTGIFSEEARQKGQNPLSHRNGSALDKSPSIMGSGGKINQLDLDIHLNLTYENQTAHRSSARSLSTPSNGPAGTENSNGPNKESDSALDAINSRLDSSNHAMVGCGSKERGDVSEMHNDDSLPGIIMEQEELSDSDEEIGENVEFEREEMADSEGDSASDSEQLVNIANEEVAVDHCQVRKTQNNPGENSYYVAVNYNTADVKPLNLNLCPVSSPHSMTTTTNAMPGHESRPFGSPVASDSKEPTKTGIAAREPKRPDDAREYIINKRSDETLPGNSRKRSCNKRN